MLKRGVKVQLSTNRERSYDWLSHQRTEVIGPLSGRSKGETRHKPK